LLRTYIFILLDPVPNEINLAQDVSLTEQNREEILLADIIYHRPVSKRDD